MINTLYQVPIILSLHCNVTLAFDKDKKIDEVLKETEKLRRYTNVNIIYDKNNLLSGKDSPVDRGKEVFLELYRRKVKLGSGGQIG
jgi:hypothetical protein